MKSFLSACFLFMLPVLLGLLCIGFLADGYTDPYYLKFVTPRQNAMIIGISRAEIGLRPDVLNPALQASYPGLHLYNFAFDLNISPFGKVYLDAIKRKLDMNSRTGVFIVTADPWSLAADKQNPGDTAAFRENKGCLAKLSWINMNPNFPYLAKCYTGSYTSILTKRIKERRGIPATSFLHNDGWVELTYPMDSASIARRVRTNLRTYAKTYLPNDTLSDIRLRYLEETICLLKEHGDVYLVQLPVSSSLAAVNDQFCPAFNAMMDSLARRQRVPFFNLTGSNAQYTYVDGSHLSKESAIEVSKLLAGLINHYKHPR